MAKPKSKKEVEEDDVELQEDVSDEANSEDLGDELTDEEIIEEDEAPLSFKEKIQLQIEQLKSKFLKKKKQEDDEEVESGSEDDAPASAGANNLKQKIQLKLDEVKSQINQLINKIKKKKGGEDDVEDSAEPVKPKKNLAKTQSNPDKTDPVGLSEEDVKEQLEEGDDLDGEDLEEDAAVVAKQAKDKKKKDMIKIAVAVAIIAAVVLSPSDEASKEEGGLSAEEKAIQEKIKKKKEAQAAKAESATPTTPAPVAATAPAPAENTAVDASKDSAKADKPVEVTAAPTTDTPTENTQDAQSQDTASESTSTTPVAASDDEAEGEESSSAPVVANEEEAETDAEGEETSSTPVAASAQESDSDDEANANEEEGTEAEAPAAETVSNAAPSEADESAEQGEQSEEGEGAGEEQISEAAPAPVEMQGEEGGDSAEGSEDQFVTDQPVDQQPVAEEQLSEEDFEEEQVSSAPVENPEEEVSEAPVAATTAPPVSKNPEDVLNIEKMDYQDITDNVLANLEKNLSQKTSVRTEKITLQNDPDFDKLGRGLIYSCKGKHWACVNAINYFRCENNYKYYKMNKSTPTCFTENVYASEADCGRAQQKMVDLSIPANFCL